MTVKCLDGNMYVYLVVVIGHFNQIIDFQIKVIVAKISQLIEQHKLLGSSEKDIVFLSLGNEYRSGSHNDMVENVQQL